MKNSCSKNRNLLTATILLAALMLECQFVVAQLKVGQNPENIKEGSVLEIESESKGLLLPRVSLFSTTTWGLDGLAVAGMQVFNNNVAIGVGLPSYPIAVGGIGTYYWDGTGWVPCKTPGSGGVGDFDWLKSSNNSNPSDPADIGNRIFHGGPDNQEVSVHTTTIAGAHARMSVQTGQGSNFAINGNFFAENLPGSGREVGLQTISPDPLVFRTTFSPEDAPGECMRIASYGTVGIHTRFPSKDIALQVNGPIVQTDFSEKEEDANSGVRMENGILTLYQKADNVTNGSLEFKNNTADLYDARISFANSQGTKGALIFEVSPSGGSNPNRAITILNENGNVGINKVNPGYKLDVTGDINATGEIRNSGVIVNSDARLKRNIHNINNGLEVISKLKPVSYEKKSSIAGNDYNKSEMGFIAQDIQKILPQLVREGKDVDKTLAVDYNSLIPILTRAIQEQEERIDTLSAELSAMKLAQNETKKDHIFKVPSK